MAFLQLALPALLKMSGGNRILFPFASARLSETVRGKEGWTNFVHARLENRDDQLRVQPAKLPSALQSMAQKDALIIIPEDRDKLAAGENIAVQLLSLI